MTANSPLRNPQLEGDDFFWKGSPTGILLIHGFTATTAEVRPAAKKLHEAGYTVAGPLLPGHGTTPENLNHATWQMWMEKVKRSYEDLIRECEQVFVIAESMGTLLALELAVQHPEIKGLCLFAPAIKVPNLWISRLLLPFVDTLNKNAKDDGLPWQGYDVYPVHAMVEMLKLQKRVRKDLKKVTQPTLVFTGEYDHSISSDAAEIVMKGLGSNYKEHIHMSDSPHCILLDIELDKAVEEIDAFIRRNLGN
jgi:carboxylesterase